MHYGDFSESINGQEGEGKKSKETPRLLRGFRRDILSSIRHSSNKSLWSLFSKFVEKITLSTASPTIYYIPKSASEGHLQGMAPRIGRC